MLELEPGEYSIEFTNGESRFILVKELIFNTYGTVVAIRTQDDTYYNWDHIISMKGHY